MTQLPRFHLAFPVHDLAEARRFYGDLLGCREGRSSHDWVDFDFFGHQIVAHLTASEPRHKAHNSVDGDEVPIRHFGVILTRAQWKALGDTLRDAGIDFLIAPHIRFEGLSGEQSTFFINDPSGNTLEFKAFADDAMIFAQ
jgi:extradiol dioxygenase family protein